MTMTSKSFISFLSQKRKSAHGNKRKVKTLVSKSRTALPLFAWQWIEMRAAEARMKLFVSLSPLFNPIYCCRCCQLLCEKFAFGSFNLNNIAAASQPPLEVFFQGVHTSRTATINADTREVEDDCLKGADFCEVIRQTFVYTTLGRSKVVEETTTTSGHTTRVG